MGLSDHVDIQTTINTVSLTREGFGRVLLVSYNATWSGDRVREYGDLAEVAVDFPSTTGPEYLAAQAIFSQEPCPESISIARGLLKPTQRYLIEVSQALESHEYRINAAGDGATSTEITVPTYTNLTFTADDSTEECTTASAHGLATGDGPFRVSNSGGALPTGLAVDTNYWVIVVSTTVVKFATTKANALADTEIDITAAGSGTHTLNTATNDVIVAGIVDRLNLVTGKNFTAATTGSSGSLDAQVTGDAAGEWFSIEVLKPTELKIAQNHADPGIATDLANILTESTDWYALLTVYNSNAMVLATAAWVEANDKIYLAEVNETDALTTSVGNSDTLDDLFALEYARVAPVFYPSPARMFSAAWYGRVLPIDAGSENWKFKNLSGVTAVTFTSAQRTKLRDRNGNSYETVGGRGRTFEGQCADGNFLDVIRGRDWIDSDMAVRVYDAMAENDKLAYDDDGVAVVEAAMRATVDEAITRKILRAGTETFSTPTVANIDAADRAARLLPDMKWSAELAGAINKTRIRGTVTA